MKIFHPGHHRRLNMTLSSVMIQYHHHPLIAIRVGSDDPQTISNVKEQLNSKGGGV